LGRIRDSARLLQKLNTRGCKPQSDSAVSSVLNAAKSVAALRGFPAFSLRAATGEKLARMLSYEKASGGDP
jgi:hypothetical protein